MGRSFFSAKDLTAEKIDGSILAVNENFFPVT